MPDGVFQQESCKYFSEKQLYTPNDFWEMEVSYKNVDEPHHFYKYVDNAEVDVSGWLLYFFILCPWPLTLLWASVPE